MSRLAPVIAAGAPALMTLTSAQLLKALGADVPVLPTRCTYLLPEHALGDKSAAAATRASSEPSRGTP